TTIRLDENLLKEAKRQAAESGMTLTAIIEDSLRERLARRKSAAAKREPIRLHPAGIRWRTPRGRSGRLGNAD
ncbi:MAG: ribbon-helix-helix protein, CopG family, partial [Proteobacteria bacterium]|nr:ribbon-helix-helix protein, CopG family [Pseudomonadota bacterium]